MTTTGHSSLLQRISDQEESRRRDVRVGRVVARSFKLTTMWASLAVIALVRLPIRSSIGPEPPCLRPTHRHGGLLNVVMQQPPNSPQEYDLARPQFDILEGRSFRRDAMLQYAVSQRSQQLRILFLSSTAIVTATLPLLTRELVPMAPNFGVAGWAVCAASTALLGSLAVREKEARGKVLLRLERELSLGELSIWQPNSALGGRQQTQLVALRGRKRLIALYGAPSALARALGRAVVYRRQLADSAITLVAVPSNGGLTDEEGWREVSAAAERDGWLWRPKDESVWRAYFDELLSGLKSDAVARSTDEGAWFALSLQGRSCASGVGELVWDELLGTKLPPLRTLEQGAAPTSTRSAVEASVLDAQRELYDALRAADSARVASLCVAADDDEVSALAASGRLDGWATVLKYDATVGLVTGSEEACVATDGSSAYTTVIEFPAGRKVGSLLATQRWIRQRDHDDAEPEWRLVQHRTIPYAADTDAAACLRCDHRGCVALQRAGRPGPAGMPGEGRA